MHGKWAGQLLAVCIAGLFATFVTPIEAADPPYVILLKNREAVVTPERTKDAQTGGGFVQVTQVEPNVVIALMRGAVAAGTGHSEGAAAMQMLLNQDFEIVPTRTSVRPPKIVMTGWALGTLDSTLDHGGTAEQSPACANINAGGATIVDLCIKPHAVRCGENLLVSDRLGPFEAVVLPGCFSLHQEFALRAVQGKAHCHPAAAAALFDPEARLDSQWNEVLKPFRAVPHKDFGFRVILRVVEDVPPVVAGIAAPASKAPPGDELPPPRPQKKPEPVGLYGIQGLEADPVDSKELR